MTSIGPLQLQTFSLALALAIVLAGLIALSRAPGRPGATLDACLVALAAGLVAARIGHILLHAAHFTLVPEDILRPGSGGLEWHAGLAGALGGLWAGARLRRVDPRALLDALTPAPALLALGAWRGCLAAGCAFGREVDTLANYPPLLVAELPDIYAIEAPRYNTPLAGMTLALAALLLAALCFRRAWLAGRRFWLTLLLLAAGMFLIGFLRADSVPRWAGLRADQWLDLAVMAGCVWPLWRETRADRRSRP